MLGVSLPTLTDWIDKGLPVAARGSRGVAWAFDVAECFAWRLDYAIANALPSVENVALADLEKRKLATETQLKEIELAERRRQVVRVEDVARIWEGRIVASRETFQGIAARLAPILVGEEDPQEIEAQIEKEIDAALCQLADWEPDEPPDDDDADGVG